MRCGWRLRPELLPPIGSSLPLFLFCILLMCPFFFLGAYGRGIR